jgi:hypothetical protein
VRNARRNIGVAMLVVFVSLLGVLTVRLFVSDGESAPFESLPTTGVAAPLLSDPAPVAAPTVADSGTQREEVAPAAPEKPPRWVPDPRLDSRLAKVKFRFGDKLRNADMVLRNDYFNPRGLTLPPAAKEDLDAMLGEFVTEAAALDSKYAQVRHAHVKRRLAGDQFERVTAEDYRGAQPKFRPRNAEEEVISVYDSKKGDVIVRIGWDDDPEVAAMRGEVLEWKTHAVEQIVAFVAEHGVPNNE